MPPTVVDQINLWEMERNRLRMTKGYLYKEFDSEEDFDAALRHARELDILLWHTKGAQSQPALVIDAEGHQLLRTFVRNRIAARQADAQ